MTRVPQTVAGGAVHARRRRPRTLLGGRASTRLLPWLLILPAAAVTLVLVAYPVGRGIWMSFTDADLKYFITGQTSWVGLDQYRAIWNDPDLRRSFANTLLLGWTAVAGTMIVGCAAGLLLNQPFRGRGVLAVLVLLPWAVPSVAATSTFKYMFNDQYGVINWAGSSLGITGLDGYTWLTGRWSALAVFMPVVAGMGGNAATQTLTVIVRGIALGELTWANTRKALLKEATVGIANGVGCGVVAGLVVWIWKGSPGLGVIIGAAMIINMFVAATAGTLIPLALRALKVDPALASSVFITTLTDVFGFLSFLGLGTLVLRHWG